MTTRTIERRQFLAGLAATRSRSRLRPRAEHAARGCGRAAGRSGRGCARSSRCRRTGCTWRASCSRRTRGRCARRSSGTAARSTTTRRSTSRSTRSPTPVRAGGRGVHGRARPTRSRSPTAPPWASRSSTAACRCAPGDEVLTTMHDHYATHESLRLATRARRRERAQGRALRRSGDGHARARWRARSARAIRPADARRRDDLGALEHRREDAGARDRRRGRARQRRRAPAATRILLCVDGVHGFGVEDVTMADLGCDFFVAGCHKWMFGPRGTGVVWGKRRAVADAPPDHSRASATPRYGAWMKGAPPPPTTRRR